jgi:DHA1 family bicyclomycin/chloramphenicol resistance-like MFS transporter
MCVAGAGFLLVTALLHLPLVAVIVSLFTMVAGVAVTNPPSTSLALSGYRDIAGTASSLLGLSRFAFGGLAAPLVGLAGERDATALGIVAAISTVAAAIAFAAVAGGKGGLRVAARARAQA